MCLILYHCENYDDVDDDGGRKAVMVVDGCSVKKRKRNKIN